MLAPNELKAQMIEWVKATKQKVKQNQPIDKPGTQFLLGNYHWIFSSHNKAQMLHLYNKVDWITHQEQFLMQSMFMQPGMMP